MGYIINDQVIRLRPPEGPLARYIAAFSKWASEQGYALCSLRQRILGSLPALVGGSQRRRYDCTASQLGTLPGTFDIARGVSAFARVMPPH